MHIRSVLLAALVAAAAVVCPARATVTAPGTSISFTGNGSTTAYTTNFPFQLSSDLAVTVAGVTKVSGTDYTVSGAGNPTGTVTFTAAPANGAAVVITRTVDYLQKTSLKSQRLFDPASIEKALDRLAMGQQQLAAQVANPVSPSALTNSTLVTGRGGNTGVQLQDWLARTAYARTFGADATGAGDSTAAINLAVLFCKTQGILGDGVASGGCTVDLGPGIFKVTSINMSNASSTFYQNLSLRGAGRWATTIVPAGTGNILIDMIGTNHSEVRELSIDSGAFVSQTGILLSRSGTSTQANNNRIVDVHILGNFSKAAAVSLSAESTSWERVRFENTGGVGGPAGDHVGFYTSDDNAQFAISSTNGTPFTSSNTDNVMTDCEFYGPYTGATLSYFNNTAGYRFQGSTWVAGTSNNVKLVALRAGTGNIFNGPIEFFGPHFEVFGTGNTAIYLDPVGATAFFKGVRVFGGYFVTSGTPALIDYDRTSTVGLPVLWDGTITGIRLPPGSPDVPIYLDAVENSNIFHMPRDGTGSLRIFGFHANSVLKASSYFVTGSAVNTQIEQFASAVPTTGTYATGQRIWHTAPAPGTPLGWVAFGPVTLGTLNGGTTTGSCTSGTNTLTLNSSTGLNVGERINIVGIGGPRIVTSISGTTVRLLTTCNATVGPGAAVSYDASLGGLVPFGTVGNGTSGVGLVSVTSAGLGTPGNGTLYYCSDCTVANPCAGGGTGAVAKRINGAWVCN